MTTPHNEFTSEIQSLESRVAELTKKQAELGHKLEKASETVGQLYEDERNRMGVWNPGWKKEATDKRVTAENEHGKIKSELAQVSAEKQDLENKIAKLKEPFEMDKRFKELFVNSKKIMKDIEQIRASLSELSQKEVELLSIVSASLTADESLKNAYADFANEEITYDQLNEVENQFRYAKNKETSVRPQIDAFSARSVTLKDKLRGLQEGLRSTERYMWQLVFVNLRSALIEKMYGDIERVIVGLAGWKGCCLDQQNTLSLIFGKMFPHRSFHFGPSNPRVESISKALKKEFFGDEFK